VSAVALAAELGPDLVLLDIQLPDLDGFAVAERLLAADPGLHVVLVSSRDRSSYGPLVEQSGARGFLAKSDLQVEALESLLG
jgi:two-component system nitrate/nitrite response regulator NarL